MSEFASEGPSLLLKTRRFSVETASHRKPDGSQHTREVIRHPGAVTIIPMVDDQHICLIKNYRVAVDETLIELPAGTLEAGEPPEKTAFRELIEETGYRARSMQMLHSFYLSPGILDERMHLFLAKDLTEGDPAREPNEEIENYVVPCQDAIKMAMDGTIHDAKTLVGLLWLARLRNW